MARGLAIAALLGACLLAPKASAREPSHPDLGSVRFEDPESRRARWLGVDIGGVVLPRRLGWYDHRVWTAHASLAWALSLAPNLAVGGRHGLTTYDLTGLGSAVRLRLHSHQLELSGSPLVHARGSRARDRLFVGVQTHGVLHMRVDDVELRPGGVRDTVAEAGYGITHPVGARWSLGWRVSGRYAWVFQDTQRHGLAALRLGFQPRPAHALWATSQLFVVHRDEGAMGDRPRTSLHGVFEGQYAWMSRAGVGPFVRARFATQFASGTTPVFETRAAAVESVYGDVSLGLRVHW